MSKEQFAAQVAADKATQKAQAGVTVVKTGETKKDKPWAKKDKPAAPVMQVNVDEFLGKLPNATVTTKDLCALFGYNDGGKTMRRTLRAKFATPSSHTHKADWTWTKTDKVLAEIITHFAKVNRKEKAAV